MPIGSIEIDDWTSSLLQAYLEVGASYFSNITRYTYENQLNLSVAMRYPVGHEFYEMERCFYLNNAHSKIQLIPQSKFSSYRAVESSKLVYTISSTLGYEALGWGKKVIFAKDIPSVRSLVMSGLWSKNFVTYNLLDSQRLYSLDYLELKNKSDNLLKINNQDYCLNIKNTKEYYMNYDEKSPTHEIIKKLINDILTGGN